MRRTIGIAVLFFLLQLCSESFAQPISNMFGDYVNKMTNYKGDFNSFSRASNSSLDKTVCSEFSWIATEISGFAIHMSDNIEISKTMKNEDDKKIVLGMTSVRAKYYITFVDIEIDTINKLMTKIDNRAIISTCMKMKEDMRDFKTALQTVAR